MLRGIVIKTKEWICLQRQTTSIEGITIDEDDEMSSRYKMCKEKPADVSVLQAMPPCYPNRVVVATFEVTSSSHTHIIFSGNTKPFQSFFVAEGIAGKSVKLNPQDAYGEYFRIVHNVDFKSAEKMKWLEEVFLDRVLKRSPVVLRMKTHSFDDAPLKEFLQKLSKQEASIKWM